MLSRYEQWDKWLKHGRPKSYWLPGFSNGSGFLTAVKQEVARANSGWALDDVVTFTEVHKVYLHSRLCYHVRALPGPNP
jgi:dynein heavy chain